MQTEKMVQPWKDIKEIVALSSDPNKWRKAQLDMKHSPTVHWHFSFLPTILRYPYGTGVAQSHSTSKADF